MLNLTIPGECVPKARPRLGRYGTYTPEKTKVYERYVKVTIQKAKLKPVDGPLKVELTIYRKIPKSFSKVKRNKAISGELLPTTKPDIDNYVKSVLDASNGMLYHDDNQIVELIARKLYAEEPRVEIRIEEL